MRFTYAKAVPHGSTIQNWSAVGDLVPTVLEREGVNNYGFREPVLRHPFQYVLDVLHAQALGEGAGALAASSKPMLLKVRLLS